MISNRFKPVPNNPLKADPTRSATLRRVFQTAMRKRFKQLEKDLVKLIVEEDAFGLKPSLKTISQTLLGNQQEFSSVQVNVEDRSVLARVREFQSHMLDPNDVLELETETHVTVRYGLHDKIDRRVRRLVKGFGRIDYQLIRLKVFQGEDKDILVMEVDSPRLHSLHRLLGSLPHTDTFPEYLPHMTIAYLRKGTGSKYLNTSTGLEDVRLFSESVKFSSPERDQSDAVLNTRFAFMTDAQKVEAFRRWVSTQTKFRILGVTIEQIEEAWFRQYIEEGYRKGAGRAFDDVRKAALSSGEITTAFFQGTRAEFLAQSFGRPIAVEKLKILVGRVFTELNGVSEMMANVMTRELADGLVQGQNPRQIATTLSRAVDISESRAQTIARTEIIRAHAEGQLDNMEILGVTEVGVAVEWSTAGDDRVCPKCAPLDGVVFSIDEARGLIPRHPNCRCAHIPSNVGEDKTGQIRSKSGIEKAIAKSIKAENPRISLKKQRKRSPWVGADRKVKKARPKSILDE